MLRYSIDRVRVIREHDTICVPVDGAPPLCTMTDIALAWRSKPMDEVHWYHIVWDRWNLVAAYDRRTKLLVISLWAHSPSDWGATYYEAMEKVPTLADMTELAEQYAALVPE